MLVIDNGNIGIRGSGVEMDASGDVKQLIKFARSYLLVEYNETSKRHYTGNQVLNNIFCCFSIGEVQVGCC